MKQLEKLMKNLDLTEEEARQLMADDKRIEKGEKLFELSAEQKQAEKEMRQTARKPTVYKFAKRERKADNEKQALINILIDAMKDCACAQNLDVINKEREFTFRVDGRKYKIVLSCPRS